MSRPKKLLAGIIIIAAACTLTSTAVCQNNAGITDLNNQGVEALANEQYKQAIKLLYRAHKLDRGNDGVRENLAVAYNNYGTSLITNKTDRAIKMLKLGRKFDNNNDEIIVQYHTQVCINAYACI